MANNPDPESDEPAPEDFPRNTGAGEPAPVDHPPDEELPQTADCAIVPTDSPGG